MSAPLNVLYLEDSLADVDLCRHALRQAGYEPEILHVDTEQAFVEGLADSFDVILADYSLPQFDALSALRHVQERGLDLPFIVVSGTVGEETAVDLIKQGADDYLLKDRLGRLGPAIESARGQRRLRSEREAIEQAMRSQDRLFRAVVENATEGLALLSKDLRLTYLSPTAERMVGMEMKHFPGLDPVAVVHPEDEERARQILRASLGTPETPQVVDIRMQQRDGTWRWAECTIDNRLEQPEVQAVVVNMRDVDGRRRAEEALRQSEENYRLLFSSNPQPMWVYDRKTLAILQVNDAAVQAYGYDAAEFRRMSILDLHPPRVHERLQEVAASLPGPIRRPGIWPQMRSDGSALEADITTHDLEFEGRPARLVMAIDVTEREHARRNLETSERRYRELTDEAPLGIYRTAPDGRILFVNPALAHMLGYDDPAELLARSLASGPFEASYSRDEFKARLEAEGEIRGLEATWTRKDGSWLHVRENARLVRSPEGAYYEGTAEDITEKKQAEQALRQLSEFNESIIRSMSEGIVLEEPDGTFAFVNPAAASMLGYRPDELLGKPFSLVRPEGEGEKVKAANQRRAHGESDRYELQLLRKDGTTFPVLVSGSPRFQDGEFSGTIAVFTDISDLKAAQERKVRRAQELEALYQTSLEVTAQRHLPSLLRTIVERAVAILDAGAGDLYLPSDDGQFMERTVGVGLLDKDAGQRQSIEDGLAGLVFRTGEIVEIEDYRTWPGRPEAFAQTPYRRVIGVPLKFGGKTLGVLNLAEVTQAGKFPPDQKRLVELFADQAAIAIENARLLEAERGRARELEALYRISLQINAQTDLAKLLDTVVEQARDLVGVDAGALALLQPDGETLKFVVSQGFGRHLVGSERRRGQGISGRVLESGQTMTVDDYAAWEGRSPGTEDSGRVVSVPLRVGGLVVGVLNLGDLRRRGAFDARSLRVAELVADQAAIAVENARLLEETRRRAARLEGVASVSGALRVATDRQKMMDIIADQLIRLLDTPHVGIVLRAESGQVALAVGRGLGEATVGIRGPADEGIAGHVLGRGTSFESHQASRDERILHSEIFRGADHVLAVPLAVQNERIGMIVTARNRPFEDEEVRLLTAVAEMAGNAINRAGFMETLEQRVAARTADLEAANARLHDLDRLKSAFVSNVSHELRTPITNILLYLDLIEQPGREERRPTYMGIVRGEAGRLHRLIEDLLMLSRLERGAVALDLEPQVLDALIAEVVGSLEERAHLKHIDLRHEPNPDMPLTPAAHGPMVQVLTNLIGNAVAYAPSGAAVTVGTRREVARGTPHAAVRVHNTAPAIPGEDLPHLFERFYRGRSGKESGEAGTGLGLSICKEIVERHHGWIEVESAPEAGTAFTVWLPLDPNE